MSKVDTMAGRSSAWKIVIEYDPTKRGRASVKYFNLTKRSEAMLVLRKAVRELQRSLSLGRFNTVVEAKEVKDNGRPKQGVRRAAG